MTTTTTNPFVAALADPASVADDPAQWLVVPPHPRSAEVPALEYARGAAFFKLRTFSSAESDALRAALISRPTTVRFNEHGHLRVGDAVYPNPASGHPSRTPSRYDDSVGRLAGGPRTAEAGSGAFVGREQYVYDGDHVISRNLLFLLLRVDGIFHLVYNPLHSQDFAEHYAAAMREGIASTVRHGATPELRTLFRNYASALVLTNGEQYLDPTTHLFLDADACARNGAAPHFRPPVPNRVVYAARDLRDFRRLIEDMRTPIDNGRTMLCLCAGPAVQYLRDHLEAAGSRSFLLGFLDRNVAGNCARTTVNKMCTISVSGHSTTVDNSQIGCGFGGEADEEVDERVEVVETRQETAAAAAPVLQEDASAATVTRAIAAVAVVGACAGVAYWATTVGRGRVRKSTG
jgi:hypothetical protein